MSDPVISGQVLTEASSTTKTGQRSLGRLDFWWFPKVGPALAIAYCAALVFAVPGWTVMRSIAEVAFVGLCAGSYGYVLNDIFDLEVDRRAGKPNRMAAFSPAKRVLLCLLTLGLGFAPALIVPTSGRTLVMLGLEYLVLTVYSVPPFRLKGRGFLGLLCDASGAHVMANLYVVSVMADGRTRPEGGPAVNAAVFVGLVCAWELCLGLIGILVHQVEDRQNDIRSGIGTFATAHDFAGIRLPMSVVYAGELLAFAGLCVVLRGVAPLLAVAAGLYGILLALKLWSQWQHYRNVGSESTLMEWWLLSHPYYEAYFPLAAAVQCAWIHPQLAVFVVLHLAVFAAAFRAQLRDLRGAFARLLLGGRLEVAEDAAASVWPLLLPSLGRRIEIAAGDPVLWKVRAVRGGLAIHSGQQYEISLKMRADKPREILFGVWQDHAPWQAAGFTEQFRLSDRWQSIQRQFTAEDDEPRGYLGLWLGGDAGSVDVRRWTIRAVARRAAEMKEGGNYE